VCVSARESESERQSESESESESENENESESESEIILENVRGVSSYVCVSARESIPEKEKKVIIYEVSIPERACKFTRCPLIYI